MSLLYKKGNWFWHLLIRTRTTRAAWRPLVELSRRRRLRFRERLASAPETQLRAETVVSAGV